MSDTELERFQQRVANPPQDMLVELYTIDGRLGAEMLAYQVRNRPQSKDAIKKIIGQIDDGLWMESSDAIAFDKEGHLLNGQHRLTSIGLTSHYTPCRFIVVWGLDTKAQLIMDVGSRRTYVQSLGLEELPKRAAATARVVFAIEHHTKGKLWPAEPGNAGMVDFLRNNPDIAEADNFIEESFRIKKFPKSPIAAAYYECAKVDPTAAKEFFTRVGDTNGPGLTEKSPEGALRDRLINWKSRGSLSRPEQVGLYDVAVRAFDAYRSGQQVNGFNMSGPTTIARMKNWRLPR